MKLDDAAARLEALGNPTRLKIYRALVRAGEEGMPVGRLQDRLDVAASTLSHHLKTLIGVGLVTQAREGTTLICHTNFDLMRGLIDYMVEECCAEGPSPARLPGCGRPRDFFAQYFDDSSRTGVTHARLLNKPKTVAILGAGPGLPPPTCWNAA
jgi:DNA-binding transcriptional ArsR family regulator